MGEPGQKEEPLSEEAQEHIADYLGVDERSDCGDFNWTDLQYDQLMTAIEERSGKLEDKQWNSLESHKSRKKKFEEFQEIKKKKNALEDVKEELTDPCRESDKNQEDDKMTVSRLLKRLKEADSWNDLSKEEQKAVLLIKSQLLLWVNDEIEPKIEKIAKVFSSFLEDIGEVYGD